MRERSALIDKEARPLSTTDVVSGIPTLDVNLVGSVATGSATAANQTTEIARLTSIVTQVTAINAKSSAGVFTIPFDAITITYPSGTQEVYKSRVGGVGGTVQQTATLNYSDSTKANLVSLVVT